MKLDPAQFFKAVEGETDTFAFTFGFGLAPEGKATAEAILDDETVTELEDGDLLIEGWAANFSGLDRDGENFMPGAFKAGVDNFLNAQAALCFHHKPDHGIGKVLDLKEVEGKGLFMRARVDKQEPSSPLYYVYNGIKKGTYKGLSVGGRFKRKLTNAGYRISDVDFTEVSVTPVPVHSGTSLAVVAGKALEAGPEVPAETPAEPKVEELQRVIDAMEPLATALEEFKALPKSHEPQAASLLSSLLTGIGNVRVFSTGAREISENQELVDLADEVETFCVTTEAKAHKLAAKVGPLPPAQPSY